VHLPRVYHNDQQHSVLIIEDCAPHNKAAHHLNTIRQVLSGPKSSERKNEVTNFVGAMLGAFVAQLQSWSLDQPHHSNALKAFGLNKSAKDIIIKETFTDFFANLAQIGYDISGNEKRELEVKLDNLERAVRENNETVTMGDLWYEDTPTTHLFQSQ
jgi:5-methylthioribose kinase